MSSMEVGGGAVSARLSLSDAVSPSNFASDSDSGHSEVAGQTGHSNPDMSRGSCAMYNL